MDQGKDYESKANEPKMVHEPKMVQENPFPLPQWQEVMQELQEEEANWNTQIPSQSGMEEDLDLDQLANIQVTTDLASIRRHLNKKLNTWATIMLILSSSVVHIEATKAPKMTEAAMLREQEIYFNR